MGDRSRTRAAVLAEAALWAVILVAAMPVFIQAARAATPLETYGRLPSLENIALSPDGSKLYQLSTHKLRTYPETERDLDTMNVIAGDVMVRHVGNDTVLFIHGIYVQDQTELALFKVNLTTNHQSVARLGGDATRRWIVDNDGEIVTEVNYYESKQLWQLKIRRDHHWFDAESQRSPIDLPHIIGFGPNGDSLLVSMLEDGDRVWRSVSLQDGKLGGIVAGSEGLNGVLDDPVTHRMIGGYREDDQTDYVFFSPQLKDRWASVVSAYSGEHVELISTSADMTKFVVQIDGPENGYRYALVDMNTARATPLGYVYAGLKDSMETRRITYEAADGLKIPAYLTLPAGRPATKLPLIVFPHGGPAARDSLEFDWWAQAMAAQGYAVLKPNYRGSTNLVRTGTDGAGRCRPIFPTASDTSRRGIIDPALHRDSHGG